MAEFHTINILIALFVVAVISGLMGMVNCCSHKWDMCVRDPDCCAGFICYHESGDSIAMESGARISPDRRVLREINNVKPEPVSPTANLRLLTTLASNLKSASPHSQNGKKNDLSQSINKDSGDTDPLKSLPRKEKSLGLLCNKFLSLYPLTKSANIHEEISLDITAKALGTEKRRIYDIINVLESLEMASKAGKNRYLWHGNGYLPGTLAKLKSLAIKIGLREQIQEIQQLNRAYTSSDFSNEESSSYFDTPISKNSSNFEHSHSSNIGDSNSKEDKSLGVMCQKFIMLFLVSLKNGVINLDIAAKVLITDYNVNDHQSIEIHDTNVRSRFKTKVRRLYDIANVLTAIGLIKKVSVADSSIRKPVFKYTGPDVDYIDFDAETPVREGTRHSLIGMATPNRSFTYSFLPQSSSTSQNYTPNRLFIGSTTPITKRREPRKRKLFGTDEKFGRTMSSPCLDVDRPSDRLDDSILQVAEMELEKLKSIEQPKSKACVKLFPRHNSESCVSETQVSGELNSIFLDSLRSPEYSGEMINNNINSLKKLSNEACSENNIIDKKIEISNANWKNKKSLKLAVCDENLVEKSSTAIINENNNLETSNFNSTTLQSCYSDVELNKNEKTNNIRRLKLKVRDSNIITIKNTTTAASKKLFVKDISSENTRTVRISPYNIQPKNNNLNLTRKFVNLANFNAKKLIPIKPSNFKVTSTTTTTPLRKQQPIVIETKISSPSNTSYAILTQVQTPLLSPGDLFKAVQIGNTLQLVPIKRNQNSIQFNDNINIQNNTNSS